MHIFKKCTALLPRLFQQHQIHFWLLIQQRGCYDPMMDVFGFSALPGGAVCILCMEADQLAGSLWVSPLDKDIFHMMPDWMDGIVVQQDMLDDSLTWLEHKIFSGSDSDWNNTHPCIALNNNAQNIYANGLSASVWDLLQNRFHHHVKWKESNPLITALRTRYSSEEIQLLETLVADTENVFESLLSASSIQPGRTTERDLARAFHKRCLDLNAEPAWGWAGCPMVCVGPSREHSNPTDQPIQYKDFLVVDFGLKRDHLCTDLQRCIYIAPPGTHAIPTVIEKAFNDCSQYIQYAARLIRPGVASVEVDRAIRTAIDQAGYPAYPNATGHPIGYATHELGPPISWRGTTDQQFEPNQIHTLEPSLYFQYGEEKALHRIGLEEMIVVEQTGTRFLSHPPSEVWIL